MSAAEHYITAMAVDQAGGVVVACVCGHVLYENSYRVPSMFQSHAVEALRLSQSGSGGQ